MWLNELNQNPHFSYIEYMCKYFDDLCFDADGYDWAIKQRLVSEDEARAVAGFHEIASDYESPTDDYDHRAILSDPNWKQVVDAAKLAQASLIKIIEDPKERRVLMPR